MLDRCYCPDPPVDGRLAIVGDEARHLARVRRVEVGRPVEVFDGRGSRHRAVVAAIGRDRVELAGAEPIPGPPPPALDLTLAAAFPKGERVDWLVEKAVELGVVRLAPIATGRSVVDPGVSKLDRLRRAVVEASKQSRRDALMPIEPVAAWDEFARSARADRRLIAHPGGTPIGAEVGFGRGSSAILAIGPEGGFADAEVEHSVGHGWRAIDLGPTILRVETAAIAGSAILMALAAGDGR